MDNTSKFYTDDFMSRPGMSFAVDIPDPKDRIQDFMNKYKDAAPIEGFEESLMTKDITLISATGLPKVTAVFEMIITPKYGSRMGNAQGGAVSLIHDMTTTMAMAPVAREDFWRFGGVSRTLSVTYLRPTKTGTRVIIDCEVLQVGKRLGIHVPDNRRHLVQQDLVLTRTSNDQKLHEEQNERRTLINM